MIVFCQIGWYRNNQGGQLLEIYHNDFKLIMASGKYVSAQSERRSRMWYLKEVEANEGDTFLIDCKTGLRGLGSDENLTFKSLYKVDSNASELSLNMYKVGYSRDIPIIKGNLELISSMSEKDRRISDIKSSLQ